MLTFQRLKPLPSFLLKNATLAVINGLLKGTQVLSAIFRSKKSYEENQDVRFFSRILKLERTFFILGTFFSFILS
jgi:hypothetical protein